MLKARKRFGQHFLEPAWADKVVKAIAPSRHDRFIENGPGPGALTSRLAARAAHVTAIENHRELAAALQPQLPLNTALVVADFLDVDLALYLAEARSASPVTCRTTFLANPVQAAGRRARLVIARGCDAHVAARGRGASRCPPSTKDYGVLNDLHGDAGRREAAVTLPPGAFRPAPASTRPSFASPSSPRRCRPAARRHSSGWCGPCSCSAGRRCSTLSGRSPSPSIGKPDRSVMPLKSIRPPPRNAESGGPAPAYLKKCSGSGLPGGLNHGP